MMWHDRVVSFWRQEGPKVLQRQPKRRRFRLWDDSTVRRRAERRDHVWPYDVVFDRTADGPPLRLLAIVDEYARECLSIDVNRRLNFEHVPARGWLRRVGVRTLFIEPGSPGRMAT